jgi:hypothetical protein
MIPAQVQKMIAEPGIYIAGDHRFPDAAVPICSTGGKLFAMRLDQELAPDRFLDSLTLAGPFWQPADDRGAGDREAKR